MVRRLGFDLDRVLPSPLVLDFGGCRSQNDNRIGERARENASGSCVFSVFVSFAATVVFRPFFFFFFFFFLVSWWMGWAGLEELDGQPGLGYYHTLTHYATKR